MSPTIHPLTYHCPHCQTAVEALPTSDEAVVCPACQQAFKLELPVAKAEPSPPPQLVLPAGVEAPAEPAAAVPAAPVAPPVAVPVSQAAAEAPEGVVALVRVSMIRRYPLRCLGYAVAILGGLVAVIWLLVEGWAILAGLVGVVLAYVSYRGLNWWLRMHHTTLTITDRRCIVETGVISRETTEFGREDIIDVHVAQDPIMRMLGVGDMVVVTNSGGRKEIVLMAIPNPDAVVQLMTVSPPAPSPAAVAAAPEPANVA